jgi:hypothetical protein
MLVGKILIAVGLLALVVPGLLLILKGLWIMFTYAIEERSPELFLLALFLTGAILVGAGTLCLKLADTPDAKQSKGDITVTNQ